MNKIQPTNNIIICFEVHKKLNYPGMNIVLECKRKMLSHLLFKKHLFIFNKVTIYIYFYINILINVIDISYTIVWT